MNIEMMVDNRNPVIVVLDMIGQGVKFEVCDLKKTEPKWYFNEDGEYVRYDG